MRRDSILGLPVLLASVLTACTGTPPAAQPAEPSVSGTLPVYHEADLVAQPGLMAEADKTLVLEVEPEGAAPGPEADLGGAGQDVVPVRYARGVEETVQWEGRGQGVAELTNEHGQLIYRVSEGGAPFTGLIPAGRYTLTVRSGAAEARGLVLRPDREAMSLHRRIHWRDEDEATRSHSGKRYTWARLTNDIFNGEDLRGAIFFESQLRYVRFLNCDMREASFEGATLNNTNFLRGTDMRGATFTGARLSGVRFDGARLDNVDFSYAEIFHTSFRGASLRGAKFQRVIIYKPDFSGADLSYADLTGVELPKERLAGANLTGVIGL